MIASQTIHKATNVGLRFASLGAKLLLTLYMGRYLHLADLGVYGLVFAAVMISTCVLGGRFDYVIGRDLVDVEPDQALRLMRDQVTFYAINYTLFAVAVGVAYFLDLASPHILLLFYFISVFESLANNFTTNLVAMGRPVLSTFLFFLRAGLWAIVVVALGLAFPETRNVETILIGWTFGGALGVLTALWVWRKLPWGTLAGAPVNWLYIRQGLKKCMPIWAGTIATMTASSMDRFIVSYYLDLSNVGVITFYGSFTAALLAIVHSGFFNFAYPRLIRLHAENNSKAFWQEVRQTCWQVATFIFFAAVSIGVILPFSAPLFNKPELGAQAMTFWLMLSGLWIRANADTFYFVLYARRADRFIWRGDFIYLIGNTLGNALFIPLFGLKGVGVTTITASSLLLLWWIRAMIKTNSLSEPLNN